MSPWFQFCRWSARCFDRRLHAPVRVLDANGTSWDKDRVGQFGEAYAARWLWLEAGCRVLYRNFRAPGGGEIDIVLRDEETLVFTEVKTRTSTAWARPGAAVDAAKQALIVRGAREWMRLLNWPGINFRFDIVEVLLTDGQPPAVTWLRHAFHLPEGERW